LRVYAIHHFLENLAHNAIRMTVPQVSKGSRAPNRQLLNGFGEPLPLAAPPSRLRPTQQ
jgi:hypothetical protein